MRPPAATLSGGIPPSKLTKPLRYVQLPVPLPPPLPLKLDTEGGVVKASVFPLSGDPTKDAVPSVFSVTVPENTYDDTWVVRPAPPLSSIADSLDGWGSQSWLQPAFQPALRGGCAASQSRLKSRLQAELPAPPRVTPTQPEQISEPP